MTTLQLIGNDDNKDNSDDQMGPQDVKQIYDESTKEHDGMAYKILMAT